MLWLAGFHALDLTTSTPDALCPPLEETRAAVKARVGEVRGDYRAEFALIRASDGRQKLELTLREREAEVLRRELPLDDAGCEDAAQAIALVLERYFDAIEKREPNQAQKSDAPALAKPAPESQLVPIARSEADSAPARQPADSGWRARAGLLYDSELGPAVNLGASFYPSAFRLGPRLRVGVALDVAPFVTRETETFREEKISALTLRSALSLPLTLELAHWSMSAGPWLELRFQRASAPTLPRGQSAYRAVPGVGGFAQIDWRIGGNTALGAGLALGRQVTGAAPRFVLLGDGASRNAVLVPDAWFAEAGLGFTLRL